MSEAEQIYVATLKGDEFLESWDTEHMRMEKEHDERLTFLKKQAEAMAKEQNDHWKRLFDELKRRGSIDMTFRYDDYKIRINEKTKQVFIKEKGSGMPSFLRHLLDL